MVSIKWCNSLVRICIYIYYYNNNFSANILKIQKDRTGVTKSGDEITGRNSVIIMYVMLFMLYTYTHIRNVCLHVFILMCLISNN